jgi:3-hydroxyisobutyrate dehydrogenase
MNENQYSIEIDGLQLDLQAIEKDLWLRLLNGSLKSKNSFHTGSFATYAENEMEQRTVVLRNVMVAEKILKFHTDIRSPKVKMIRSNNTIHWLFYCDKCRLQFRMKGTANIYHQDEKSLTAWKETSLNSRKCYLTTISPSKVIDSPDSGLAPDVLSHHFTLEESEIAYQNFAVIESNISSIDWLWLNHEGHKRARFQYQDQQLIKASWLNP